MHDLIILLKELLFFRILNYNLIGAVSRICKILLKKGLINKSSNRMCILLSEIKIHKAVH